MDDRDEDSGEMEIPPMQNGSDQGSNSDLDDLFHDAVGEI